MSTESEWIWSADHDDYYRVIANPREPSGYTYIWSKSGVPEPQRTNDPYSGYIAISQPNTSQFFDSQTSYTTTTSQPSGRYSPPETSATIMTYGSTSPHWANPAQTHVDIVDNVRRFIIADRGHFEYVIPGHINGNIPIKAFPDTCSTFNVVSESFLRANGIDFNSSQRNMITLPNRTAISTIGDVDLPFQFMNNTVMSLTFAVLATCVHDVMIGTLFLQRCNLSEAHQSWKTIVQRQHKQVTTHRPQVCLANAPQQAVTGYINDCETAAAPDTGSEVNLIRLDYAIKLGLDIDDSDIRELELIDGSYMMTCGIIREAVWRFGIEGAEHRAKPRVSSPPVKKRAEIREFGQSASLEEEYVCDFLVIRDLAVKLILSADLLYGLDAFMTCSTSFSSSHGNGSRGMLIREKTGWKASVWNFFGGSRTTPPVNRAGTFLTVEQNEAQLRNDNEENIRLMPPGPLQYAAWNRELRRRAAYDASHPNR